jgi:Plavaka transposase
MLQLVVWPRMSFFLHHGLAHSPHRCPNPTCPKADKRFKSERAFSIHLTRSIDCRLYIQEHLMSSMLSQGKKSSHAKQFVSATITSGPPTNVVALSNHRPALLRRDHINTLYPPTLSRSHDIAPGEDHLIHSSSKDNADASETDGHEYTDTWFDNPGNLDITTTTIGNDRSTTDAYYPKAFPYSTDQKWTVALLKLLDEMHAPDYAFRDILSWARSATSENYSFYPRGGLSRSRNLDYLFRSLSNSTQLLPTILTVPPPSLGTQRSPSDVIAFDFVPQLLNLLQNRSIMVPENLVIDIDNPLLRYEPSDKRLGEAISGSVYREAYNKFISQPSRQLFVPIIQWIDRTSVTGNERFSLKPYMFTPAIFKESFRRTIKAWGYHGFLPKSKVSSAQNQTKRPGDNIREYHQQLKIVLETFRTAEPRLRNVLLPIGPDRNMTVDIICCILFVIQDMQEGDLLCGRYGPHTPNIQRHSRACNARYTELDDPCIECRYVYARPMAHISIYGDEAIRKQWSQHHVDNVFNHMPMADPVRGIFGATPVETMHAFRKGIIEMVTFLVLDNVPPSKKAILDELAIKFHRTHRQSHRKAYPATDFSNGITNLTKISAAERLGLVFLFIILAQYDEGWHILDETLIQRTETNLKNVLHVFEALVCFDAWLKEPCYWCYSNNETASNSAKQSIRVLLRLCRKYIPFNKLKPDCWKFPKFHELLHIPDDIMRFGSPSNFCAQRPESLLIQAAKHPGRRARKVHEGSLYELNAAQALSNSLLIDIAYNRIFTTGGDESSLANETISHDPPSPGVLCNTAPDAIQQSTGSATFGQITRQRDTSFIVKWNTVTDISRMELPVPLLSFVCDRFGNSVVICTEYKREEHTFRCHPYYQSNGPINDWMLVMFEEGSFPCRLAIVVMTDDESDPIQLVVQSATRKTHADSVILSEWLWSDEFYVVSPDTIEGPAFVISIKDDNSKILVTLPYDQWAGKFSTVSDDEK